MIYIKGASQDEDLENLCAEIGDLHQTGGLCMVANREDADTMAVLKSTVEVANTFDARIFSISLGDDGRPSGAVRSDSHLHVSNARVGRGDDISLVKQVLTELVDILKARRG